MKKQNLLTTLALALLFTGFAQAQTSIILTPEIGIHSSKSTPTGDLDISDDFQGMDVNYSGIFSYQGGIGVGIQVAGNWGLLTGIKYNRKGGRVRVETRDPNNPFAVFLDDETVTTDVGEVTLTTTHNWLSVPILVRGQFGGTFKAGLAIGPQINMGIGKYKEKVEYDLENTNLSTEETEFDFGKSTQEVLKKSHISLLVMPYVSYDITKNSALKLNMMIEAGANMVNDNFVVATGENSSRNVNATMRNTQVGLMISYEYRFGLKTGVKY